MFCFVVVVVVVVVFFWGGGIFVGGVSIYILCHAYYIGEIGLIGESTIYQDALMWVVFMKAIFMCLNLKPDDE